MNYKEAIEYINDKNRFGSKLGLDSIGILLDLLDNPEKDIKYIHIGGTNGKGSTSSFISNILIEAGYNIGIFTSPYINRFNERIRLNNQDIPDEILGRLTEKVKEKCDEMVEIGLDHPTTFEIVTAIGFLYFKEMKVDYALMEVGLGGRFDSTNIIKNPEAVVLTTINYDHTDVLGESISEIAYEKAGIIKDDSLVVSYMQEDDVKKVLNKETKEKSGEIYYLKEEEIRVLEMTDEFSKYNYIYKNYRVNHIEIGLLGEHQIYNSALAIKTILLMLEKGKIEVTIDDIKNGLKKTSWPARLELINKKPKFLIDGAHNIQSVKGLIEALELFEYDKLILGIGILKDKDYKEILNMLIPKADKIIGTEIDMDRKLDIYDLMKELNQFDKEIYMEKDIKKAIDKSMELADEDDLILFAGSLYLVSQVRNIVNTKKKEAVS